MLMTDQSRYFSFPCMRPFQSDLIVLRVRPRLVTKLTFQTSLLVHHLIFISLLFFCTSCYTVACSGLYPHFRDFHTSLCGLLLVWTPLSSIRRCILGTGLRCALEFRVIEFSRVSDPLRRIQNL